MVGGRGPAEVGCGSSRAPTGRCVSCRTVGHQWTRRLARSSPTWPPAPPTRPRARGYWNSRPRSTPAPWLSTFPRQVSTALVTGTRRRLRQPSPERSPHMKISPIGRRPLDGAEHSRSATVGATAPHRAIRQRKSRIGAARSQPYATIDLLRRGRNRQNWDRRLPRKSD